MNRSDFTVVSNHFRTLISFRNKPILTLDQPDLSNPAENIINQQKHANKIINDIIEGESEHLLAQAYIHALAYQN